MTVSLARARRVLSIALMISLVSLLVAARSVTAVELDLPDVPLRGIDEVTDDGVPNQGDLDGGGLASVSIDSDAGELCYTIVVRSIAAPTAAHIHQGYAGTNGPIVVTLSPPHADETELAECIAVDSTLLEAIAAEPNGYYINVHTDEYPNGAVRGQLRRFIVDCWLAVFHDAGEGADIAFVIVGETVEIGGLFSPGPTAEIAIYFDALLVDSDSVPVSAPLYDLSFTLTPEEGDEGTWTIVGENPAVPGCWKVVQLFVGGAPAPPDPTPTPVPLPNTASDEAIDSPAAAGRTLALVLLLVAVPVLAHLWQSARRPATSAEPSGAPDAKR